MLGGFFAHMKNYSQKHIYSHETVHKFRECRLWRFAEAHEGEGMPLTGDDDFTAHKLFSEEETRPSLRMAFRSMSVYASATPGPKPGPEDDTGKRDKEVR